MPTMKGFIVYPSYTIEDNKAYINLYGRLENGDSFLTINHCYPYFYIKTADSEKAENLIEANYESTDFITLDKEPVTKVELNLPTDVPKVRKIFNEHGIVCYEADVRFTYRYLIDNDIKGCIEIDGEAKEGLYINKVFNEPKIRPASFIPRLNVLSIDIETDAKATLIYAIALYTKEFQKVLIVKDKKFRHAESFRSEKELLLRFKELIYKLDPDIITGWNVIDFDLSIILKRFNEHDIDFDLGKSGRPCRLKLTDSFFTDSSADFQGRIVLDGIHLTKVSFIKLKNYKLDTAAETILGDRKIYLGESKWADIEKHYHQNPQKLIDYNLKDAKLAYEIVNHSSMLGLTIKRCMLTRMQLDRVNASIASFDSLYLKELQKRKIVAPTVYTSENDERIKGGYVMEPKPGIYDNISVLDFKSLYPSIIRTFNIDPASYVENPSSKKGLIESPNHAYFKNQNGILPQLIETLSAQREVYKKSKDKIGSFAIKTLMNSFFGVLANPSCRFYNLKIANAITHFGQFIIKLTAEEIKKKGYDVIYSDTDSVFIDLKEKDPKIAEKTAKAIQKGINLFYQNYTQQAFNRQSFLELEFEKLYTKFMMPKIRGGEAGAKKRYVGLRDGKLEFTGMESARSDWTELAKNFQREFIGRIFNNKPIAKFIKAYIKNLNSGKLDKLLVYRKSIRKPVSAYTKTSPPHIKAARKVGRNEVGVIEYVQTTDGPETADARKHAIDYEHYINKQIMPLADSVLCFFNLNTDDILKGNTQKSLLNF